MPVFVKPYCLSNFFNHCKLIPQWHICCDWSPWEWRFLLYLFTNFLFWYIFIFPYKTWYRRLLFNTSLRIVIANLQFKSNCQIAGTKLIWYNDFMLRSEPSHHEFEYYILFFSHNENCVIVSLEIFLRNKSL